MDQTPANAGVATFWFVEETGWDKHETYGPFDSHRKAEIYALTRTFNRAFSRIGDGIWNRTDKYVEITTRVINEDFAEAVEAARKAGIPENLLKE